MIDATLDETEAYLIEQIKRIQRAHEQAAKPYVDRLAKLRSLRRAPVLVFPGMALSDEVLRDIKAALGVPDAK